MDKLFLRTFLVAGVGITLATGVVRYLMVGSLPSPFTLVLRGVSFGLLMASVTALSRPRHLDKRGFDPRAERPKVDVLERVAVALPRDEAIALCRAAVERVPRARNVKVDAAAGTLSATVAMTWASFGEQIECRATEANGGTVVFIRSRPSVPTTLVDYGKNRQNVDRIRTYVARRAAARHAASLMISDRQTEQPSA